MQEGNSDSKKCHTCGACMTSKDKEEVIYKAGCKLALIMCPAGEMPDCPNQVKAKTCPDAILCCKKPEPELEPEKVCPGDGLCKDCAGH